MTGSQDLPPLTSQDLWTRLALLDRRCSLTVHRDQSDLAGHPRLWRVTIGCAPGDVGPSEPITLTGPSLVSVLTQAIAKAEEFGLLP
jgi:hypothetical protein